jgi:enolase-phosphatase E1
MKLILTDVEGTTTSLSFVQQTLFPYSLEKLESFVLAHEDEDFIKEQLFKFDSILSFISTLKNYIETDKKEKILKDIQGMIWKQGYELGELKGHVYPDVEECLRKWKEQNLELGVYSSGSVAAQKLLFKHSISGDLDQYFTYNFDTSIGHKRESTSYDNILMKCELYPDEVLFLSDIKEELDAAKEVGMNTIQLVRDGEISYQGHQQVSSFLEIVF